LVGLSNKTFLQAGWRKLMEKGKPYTQGSARLSLTLSGAYAAISDVENKLAQIESSMASPPSRLVAVRAGLRLRGNGTLGEKH